MKCNRNYTSNQLINEFNKDVEKKAVAIEKIKLIFDEQIIPEMIKGEVPYLMLNNCLCNIKNTGMNFLFTMDLIAIEQTDKKLNY